MPDPSSIDSPEPLPDEIRLAHERAESLLPWAATGKLSDPDRAWLDEWLASTEAGYPRLVSSWRAELAWLQRTARDVQLNVALPDPEQGLDKLLGRIADDRMSARSAVEPRQAASAIGWWARARTWTHGHGPQLAGACAVLVIAQVATLAWMEPTESSLDPLEGGTGVVDVKGTVLLKLAFSPRATEADVRAALLAAHARVVDGPSGIGLYLVRVKAEDLDAAIEQWRGQPQVVESYQRVK